MVARLKPLIPRDPLELPSALLPVQAFDEKLLPEKLRGWVRDVSNRMQAPIDFAAAAVMSVLGSLIGRKVAIRPKLKDNWAVIANLWAMLIGLPGVMKSPTQSAMMHPLNVLQIKAREAYNTAKAEYDMRVSAAKVKRRHNEKQALEALGDGKSNIDSFMKQEALEEPTLKRYFTTSASAEALAELCRQNPDGFLVDRDEVMSLVDKLDEEGRAEERGFYLSAWNGDKGWSVDRISRGFDLSAPACCISILGGTQPGRITQYLGRVLSGETHNDGLI